MSTIEFKALGADIEYDLADNAHSEQLRINGELIVDCSGDVGAWGDDYHLAIVGLNGAAKEAATRKYLRKRAEALIITEIFQLRETIKTLDSHLMTDTFNKECELGLDVNWFPSCVVVGNSMVSTTQCKTQANFHDFDGDRAKARQVAVDRAASFLAEQS